ncbi:hypothetical protein EYR40_009594 [Pleurotus pulmonarius]|nr:hypothetical protein EYR38_009310 [Pleurotus pulmonarius]KAF4590997.1 hypothetical protein EYR40_009594 [Pleurotus pulmonarius]
MFHCNMTSVYAYLKASSHKIRDDLRFMLGQFMVSMWMDGLQHHVEQPRPKTSETHACVQYTNKMVYYTNATMTSLKVFLCDLNQIVAETTTVPNAPVTPFLLRKVAQPSKISLATSASPTLNTSTPARQTTAAPKPPIAPAMLRTAAKPSKISLATSISPTVVSSARRKGVSSVTGLPILECMDNTKIGYPKTSPAAKFVHKLLRRIRKSKVASPPVALFALPPIGETSAIKDALLPDKPKPLPDLPYENRRSAIYFQDGMDLSNVDMERLMPTHDSSSIRLTSDGALKCASLASLIRILTSPEADRMPGFTHTFFVCFVFFASPQELLDGLAERFHAGQKWQHANLSKQEANVVAEETLAIRASVVRALTTWLWEYWRPETDRVLLRQIMNFASRDIAEAIPDLLLVWGLAQAVWHIHDKKHYRGIKLESPLEVPAETTLPAPTSFCVWGGRGDRIRMRTVLETENGREEFVRQITIKASKMFAAINPSDAIRYWKRKGGTRVPGLGHVRHRIEAFKTFERGVTAAVVSSILESGNPVERTIMLEYWLDVASRCVNWRNYCVANCISSAIQTASVLRLKITIALACEESKKQYHRLVALFDGASNFASHRATIAAEKKPAVPPMFHFEHDVSAIRGITKTSVDNDGRKTVSINFVPVRAIMKVLASMEEYRIDYCLHSDENFQDWLKGSIDTLEINRKKEQELLDTHYNLSQKRESSCPQLQQKHVDVWSHPITYYWTDYPGPFRTEPTAPSVPSSRSIASKQ